MDKFKAILSDKKNQPIVGAVAGIVLVLVVLFYLKQFGVIGGGGSEDYEDTAVSTEMSTTADGSGGASTDTSAVDTASTDTGAASTAASAPAAAGGKLPPMLAYRKDPFMGFSGPPKKQDAMMAILPSVRRIRLAPARLVDRGSSGQAMEVEEVLPPQPMRRVAGIMWGTTVKAILETGGKTIIVQPGQPIPDERVRVESIEPTGLTLTTLDTKRPMSIRVNLAGSPAAQEEASSTAGGAETPPSSGWQRPRSGGAGSAAPAEAPPPGF